MNKKQMKYRVLIEVYEEDGKPIVHYSSDEDNTTMEHIGLVIYKMKQIEQGLIDRIWDGGGEGYEIIDKGDDKDEEEN